MDNELLPMTTSKIFDAFDKMLVDYDLLKTQLKALGNQTNGLHAPPYFKFGTHIFPSMFTNVNKQELECKILRNQMNIEYRKILSF